MIGQDGLGCSHQVCPCIVNRGWESECAERIEEGLGGEILGVCMVANSPIDVLIDADHVVPISSLPVLVHVVVDQAKPWGSVRIRWHALNYDERLQLSVTRNRAVVAAMCQYLLTTGIVWTIAVGARVVALCRRLFGAR